MFWPRTINDHLTFANISEDIASLSTALVLLNGALRHNGIACRYLRMYIVRAVDERLWPIVAQQDILPAVVVENDSSVVFTHVGLHTYDSLFQRRTLLGQGREEEINQSIGKLGWPSVMTHRAYTEVNLAHELSSPSLPLQDSYISHWQKIFIVEESLANVRIAIERDADLYSHFSLYGVSISSACLSVNEMTVANFIYDSEKGCWVLPTFQPPYSPLVTAAGWYCDFDVHVNCDNATENDNCVTLYTIAHVCTLPLRLRLMSEKLLAPLAAECDIYDSYRRHPRQICYDNGCVAVAPL